MIRRIEFLRGTGAAAMVALTGCGGRGDVIAIGSKDFTESMILGEMYAQLLETHGFSVHRRLGLGTTQVATAALRNGAIDVYPEYTGTAALVVLHAPIMHNDGAEFSYVAREYKKQFGLTWLEPAPMNNSQALAVTEATAAQYGLHTLEDLPRVASQLRLGAIPEFMQRADGLPALRRTYGAIAFKDVKLLDIGVKYRALLAHDVDIVVAFGTDGRLASDHLLVLTDTKHAWPGYHVAPVIRSTVLATHPTIQPILNALASHLTDEAMRHVNAEVDGKKRDLVDVATEFLRARQLVHSA